MNSEKFEAEYKELKKQTKKYYLDNVKEKLEELESTRISQSLLLITSNVILVVFFVCVFIVIPGNIFKKIFAFIVFLMVIAPLISLINYFIIKQVKDSYRNEIKNLYPLLLKQFHLGYRSGKNSYYMQHLIDKSKLFPRFSTIVTDDTFIGKYNDVDFEIAEISFNANADHTNRIFNDGLSGAAITFAFNKEINALTRITPKFHNLKFLPEKGIDKLPIILAVAHFSMGLLAIICAILSHEVIPFLVGIPFVLWPIIFCYYSIKGIKKKNEKYQKVKLEDVDFSKDYDVYSEDQIESRYLITPAFIERFMFLQKVFNTKNICCAFVEDQILLFISSKKNLFEIGNFFTSLKNPKYVEKFYDEIIAILLLVNHFKLNEHTGL